MRVIMRQVLTTPSVDNALSFIVFRYLPLLNKLFASGCTLEGSTKNAKENKGNAFPPLVSFLLTFHQENC